MLVKKTAPLSWQQLTETFLHLKRLQNLSPATLEWYEVTFKLFDRFHKTNGLNCTSPITCPPSHIQGFLWWLNQKDRAITVHTKFRALRAFFRWLVREGLRSDNPIERVHPPKVNEPLPKTVTEEHFAKVMATLNLSKFTDLREAAIISLAFDSGARLGELLNLRLEDIDLTARTAKVKGKGGKERLIYFGNTTAHLISRYLTARTFHFGAPLTGFVFVTKKGGQLSKNQVQHRWRQLQRRAGLNPLPFHGLRHGFARMWLLRGGDAFSLQLLLGHTSAEVTKRYVTLWGSDLQRLHSERAPVDSIALKFTAKRKSQRSR